MFHVPIFWALLIVSSGLAARFGGGPERVAATMFVVAATLTRLSFEPVALRFYEVEISALIIDFTLLLALLVLVVLSDRYWPICMVALHALSVAAHVAKGLDHTLVRKAYSIALAWPSYATILVLLIGTVRHQRRVLRNGTDNSWNRSLLTGDRRRPVRPLRD